MVPGTGRRVVTVTWLQDQPRAGHAVLSKAEWDPRYSRLLVLPNREANSIIEEGRQKVRTLRRTPTSLTPLLEELHINPEEARWRDLRQTEVDGVIRIPRRVEERLRKSRLSAFRRRSVPFFSATRVPEGKGAAALKAPPPDAEWIDSRQLSAIGNPYAPRPKTLKQRIAKHMKLTRTAANPEGELPEWAKLVNGEYIYRHKDIQREIRLKEKYLPSREAAKILDGVDKATALSVSRELDIVDAKPEEDGAYGVILREKFMALLPTLRARLRGSPKAVAAMSRRGVAVSAPVRGRLERKRRQGRIDSTKAYLRRLRKRRAQNNLRELEAGIPLLTAAISSRRLAGRPTDELVRHLAKARGAIVKARQSADKADPREIGNAAKHITALTAPERRAAVKSAAAEAERAKAWAKISDSVQPLVDLTARFEQGYLRRIGDTRPAGPYARYLPLQRLLNRAKETPQKVTAAEIQQAISEGEKAWAEINEVDKPALPLMKRQGLGESGT